MSCNRAHCPLHTPLRNSRLACHAALLSQCCSLAYLSLLDCFSSEGEKSGSVKASISPLTTVPAPSRRSALRLAYSCFDLFDSINFTLAPTWPHLSETASSSTTCRPQRCQLRRLLSRLQPNLGFYRQYHLTCSIISQPSSKEARHTHWPGHAKVCGMLGRSKSGSMWNSSTTQRVSLCPGGTHSTVDMSLNADSCLQKLMWKSSLLP